MAGVGVVARRVQDGASSARGWTLRLRLAQAVLGQRRVGFDLIVVVGGGWALAASTAWPTGGGWMRGGSPSVGSCRRPRYVVMV
jgi:hypothetical protein